MVAQPVHKFVHVVRAPEDDAMKFQYRLQAFLHCLLREEIGCVVGAS